MYTLFDFSRNVEYQFKKSKKLWLCIQDLSWNGYLLVQCLLQEYQVKSSWRHRHAAMTPMFATQTGQTQMEVDDESVGIRATQDAAQFTQTVEQGTICDYWS